MHLLSSAIIPAAGVSGRMGRDKALLPNGAGLTFAGHLVNRFNDYGCDPVILVVNAQHDPSLFQTENLVTVVNHHIEKGRSRSIHLGLQKVPEGHVCFIQNVDNPFLENVLLNMLMESLPPDGYVVPVYRSKGGHPILLGMQVVDFLRSQKDLTDFRRELDRFVGVEVPFPDERILLNINTPGDYQEFMHWQEL